MEEEKKATELYNYFSNLLPMGTPKQIIKECALKVVQEVYELPINEWCAIAEPYQDEEYWERIGEYINDFNN